MRILFGCSFIMKKSPEKIEEEFNPFKVDIPLENLNSTIRTEAMLHVLMHEVAEIKSKQGLFWWLKSKKKIYQKMVDMAVEQAKQIYDNMDKYL